MGGAKLLAEGLGGNKGIKTLVLLQQAVKSFGDDCLDAFVLMYSTNITLTKITWRLDSRKSFMLAKLQTRNIEIQKRIREGKDYQDLLPDALKGGGAPAAAPAAASEEEKPVLAKRGSSVKEIEEHVEAISEQLGEVKMDDPPPEDAAPAEAPTEEAAPPPAEA